MDFQEKQKFSQWWLWMLLIGIACIPIYGVYRQIIIGEPFGSKPLPDIGLILFLLFTLFFIGLFWAIRMDTTIDSQGIRVRFFPFTSRVVKWEDIKTARVLNYGFVGGWGIRLWTKYGTVYNVRGNIGLAIELENGQKLCIGTQKEQELKKVVAALRR